MADKFIVVTLEVVAEGKHFVSRCLELGTASFGNTIEEAFENVADASLEYLNSIERLGERRRIFAEKGIRMRRIPPKSPRTVVVKPDAIVRSRVLPLAA